MSQNNSAESDINKTEYDKTEPSNSLENEKAPSEAPRVDSDAPLPSMTIAGRGLMGQDVPDVTTGSTPLTRRDD